MCVMKKRTFFMNKRVFRLLKITKICNNGLNVIAIFVSNLLQIVFFNINRYNICTYKSVLKNQEIENFENLYHNDKRASYI